MQKIFSKSGLTFSYLTSADLSELVEMLKNPAVCAQVFFGPNSRAETEAYFKPIAESISEAFSKGQLPENHVFIIRKDGQFIGNCALISNSYAPGNLTIGYTIDELHWGKGYGNAACCFLIEFGFSRLHAYRLSGDCMSENHGSRRIMEKNGFQLEGVQKKYWLKQGKYYDNLLFGLLKPEPVTRT